MNQEFQCEVIERLTRIETELSNKPCFEHSKVIDELKTFKIQTGVVLGILGSLWIFFSGIIQTIAVSLIK